MWSIPICLIKVWPTTPEGFEPSIKVSLLDKLQSWALHRSAVDHAAKKEMEASLHAWHASIINDPGNIEVMGEYFDFLLEQDLQRLAVVDAARSGLWYLRLTSTNRTAVRRVSKVFDFYGHHDLNRFFLDEIREDLNAEERKFFLKSTFFDARIETFRETMESIDETLFEQDATLSLYRSAYLAAWGPLQTTEEHLALLRKALTDPQTEELAHLLNLKVSFQRNELEHYRSSFNFALFRQSAKLIHYCYYWQMLLDAGRKDEVIAGLHAYNFAPTNAREAELFVIVARDLNQNDLALAFLQQYADQFPYDAALWLGYADLLTEMQQWNQLREAALSIRYNLHNTASLRGLSFFMEARAALAEHRPQSVAASLQQCTWIDYDQPSVAYAVGKGVADMGFPTEALSLLKPLAEVEYYQNATEYWARIVDLALTNSLGGMLLEATENLYRIDGSNVVYRNNLAAALLSERQNPEKALRLTLEIIQEYEEIHYASAINHALALALNRRYKEATDWMNRIPQEEVQGALKTPYHLAWLEIAFERRDMEAARRHAREIQEDVLMPGDKVWLERVLYELDQDRS